MIEYLLVLPAMVKSNTFNTELKTKMLNKISALEVKGTFDRFATQFDSWFRKNRKIFLSEMNAVMLSKPEGVTLDVGVGSGVFSSNLPVELGVDLSISLLKLSRDRGLQVVQADASNLPLRNSSFDSVVSTFTICFVENLASMLGEAKRVLRKGGKLVVGEITADSSWGRKYSEEGKRGHRFYSKARFFTFRDTVKFLRSSGFEPKHVFGTISYSPEDRPRIERAYRLGIKDKRIKNFSFLVVVSFAK
jgi:ubiquinone/menaquinone biosynthesis C-methylase UbiE